MDQVPAEDRGSMAPEDIGECASSAGPTASTGGSIVTSSTPNIGIAEEYLPSAASLLEQLDKRTMIVLRDGRHLVGKLRSFDQFMNLILEDTCERVLLTGKYCDFPLGLYIVRGDNIVLLGEIDEERETETLECIDQETYIQISEGGDGEVGKIVWDFE